MDGESLYRFTKWLAEVITDGQYGNVWLALMPKDLQPHLYAVGHALAAWLGF